MNKSMEKNHSKQEQLLFLQQVFQQFDQHHVQYALLRNYEFLLGSPMKVESLDTIITKKDFLLVHYILTGLNFVKRKPQFSLTHHAYFHLLSNGKKVSFDLQVGGIHWNDMPYLNEIVLQNRIKKGSFYTLSQDDVFIMFLVHSILGKRYFKPKYQRILVSLAPLVDQHYVLQHLSRIFNPQIARELFHLIKTDQFFKIKPYPLIVYFLTKRPSRLLTFSALFYRWLRWKHFFRLAPLISFIGPDGAGKSTTVESLRKYLHDYGKQTLIIYTGRGKGQILPFRKIGNAYKRQEKKKDAKIDENLKNSYHSDQQVKRISLQRRFLYFVAAPIFTFDLLLRYWLSIFPQRLRKRTVITDRFCSDIYLMKNIPRIFRKFLLRLFPKPTLTFYLSNSAEVLYQRRPKESLEELRRQLALFAELRPYLRPVEIQTNNKKEDSRKVNRLTLTKMLKEWY